MSHDWAAAGHRDASRIEQRLRDAEARAESAAAQYRRRYYELERHVVDAHGFRTGEVKPLAEHDAAELRHLELVSERTWANVLRYRDELAQLERGLRWEHW